MLISLNCHNQTFDQNFAHNTHKHNKRTYQHAYTLAKTHAYTHTNVKADMSMLHITESHTYNRPKAANPCMATIS